MEVFIVMRETTYAKTMDFDYKPLVVCKDEKLANGLVEIYDMASHKYLPDTVSYRVITSKM